MKRIIVLIIGFCLANQSGEEEENTTDVLHVKKKGDNIQGIYIYMNADQIRSEIK